MMRGTTLLAALAVFSAGAFAQAMDRDTFKAHQARIQAEYLAAKARCKPLPGNQRDLCGLRAMGARHVARAELDLQYRPGAERVEKLSLAKAEAAYALAKEGCDELRGHQKDICRKDAKANLAAARADAKSLRAGRESGPYSPESKRERAVAQRNEHDALYEAGKERCDAMQGTTRDLCVADLRKRFGKL